MSRRLWANLLFVEGNYFFVLNEEVEGAPTLLFFLAKNSRESLLEFLLRSKQEADKQLKVKIQQIFLLVDLGAQVSQPLVTLSTTPKPELLFNHKQFLEGFSFFKFGLEQLRISPKLLTEIALSTQKAKLKVLRIEAGTNVVANYFSRNTKNVNFLILHTNPQSLNLLRFNGKTLIESVEVVCNWEGLITKLQKTLQLSKKQIELFLLSGVNLTSTQTQLHPLFRDSVCVWHFKRFLSPLLKTLVQNLKPSKSEVLLVTGFLRTVGGLQEYLKRVFLAPYLRVETKISGASSLIFFFNQALNYSLLQADLRGGWYESEVIGVKLRRVSKMFNLLNWFFFWPKKGKFKNLGDNLSGNVQLTESR